jgi:hypothetical protein
LITSPPINSIVKKEKKLWQENKINSFEGDSSSIWKHVKNWLGWTSGGPPTRLLVAGQMFVLGISESNFKIEHDKGDVKIDDYDIYLAKTFTYFFYRFLIILIYLQISFGVKTYAQTKSLELFRLD